MAHGDLPPFVRVLLRLGEEQRNVVVFTRCPTTGRKFRDDRLKTIAFMGPVAKHLIASMQLEEGELPPAVQPYSTPRALVVCSGDEASKKVFEQTKQIIRNTGLNVVLINKETIRRNMQPPINRYDIVVATTETLLRVVGDGRLNTSCIQHVCFYEAVNMLIHPPLHSITQRMPLRQMWMYVADPNKPWCQSTHDLLRNKIELNVRFTRQDDAQEEVVLYPAPAPLDPVVPEVPNPIPPPANTIPPPPNPIPPPVQPADQLPADHAAQDPNPNRRPRAPVVWELEIRTNNKRQHT